MNLVIRPPRFMSEGWGSGLGGVKGRGLRCGGKVQGWGGCEMWRWGFMCDVRVSGVFAVRCGVWGAGVWGVGVRMEVGTGVRCGGVTCEGGVLCVMWECQVCLLWGVVCEVQRYEVWGWGMEVGTGVRCGGVRVSGVFAAGTWCVRCRGIRCGVRYGGKVQGWGVGVWECQVCLLRGRGVWGAGVWGVGVRYGGKVQGWGVGVWDMWRCGFICDVRVSGVFAVRCGVWGAGYEVWGWSMEVSTGVRCGGVRCEGGVLCVMWECQVCLLWGRGVWGAGVWGVGVRYGGRHRGEVWGCESVRCVCCGDVVCEVQGYEVWGEVWR